MAPSPRRPQAQGVELQQEDLDYQLRGQDAGRPPPRLPPGEASLHPHRAGQEVGQKGEHQKPVHPKLLPP
ncbi:hypothetical protein Thermus77923_18670 [Thermus oshimai]